eukprot:8717315-Pyramimonas_sp.AAC.1
MLSRMRGVVQSLACLRGCRSCAARLLVLSGMPRIGPFLQRLTGMCNLSQPVQTSVCLPGVTAC